MKWIVYLLLLVNLGVFVWHFQSGSATPVPSTASAEHEDAVLSLVLLKEYQQQKQDENTRWCYSVGPFETKKLAGTAATILHAAGIQAQRRLSTEARRKAYWVLLPPAESREAAKKNIARLKQLKVDDYFLVQTGDMVNAVSLGVFTMFESAHRRIKEIQDLGFKPAIEKIELPKREYWLDWPQESGRSVTESDLNNIRKLSPEGRQIERSCGKV
jgi:hypothetical protein